MCGRFAQFNQGIEGKFQAKPKKNTGELLFNFNYAPGNNIKAIVKEGERYIVNYKWGLTADWTIQKKLNIINIRSDTLTEKNSFQDLFRNKRCLIIADGFYEWKKSESGKIPYYITMRNKETFAFAGLWNSWINTAGIEILSCAIITTGANELVRRIHDRMPVIIPESGYDFWLDNTSFNKEKLEVLLAPCDPQLMDMYEVSGKVNYIKTSTSDLIQPVKNDNLFQD